MSGTKGRSLRALDALNFCNAGIQTGLGPFMSIFYTSVRHWNPGQIGTLIACQSLTGIAIQGAVGNFVDESHHKKVLTAAAALVVAAGAVCIAVLPSYGMQVAVQLIIGTAVTIFPAVTGAFALGMSEKDELTKRVARNETFTHTGNVTFAVTAAIVATGLALAGIFYAAAVFAAGMAVAVYFIGKDDVHHEAARASPEGREQHQPTKMIDLLKDKRIIFFTAAVILFNVSNAATLPLVGEILSKDKHGSSSAWQISAAVAIAELVMVGTAVIAGRKADPWGRKPLFLLAFGFLAIRNALSVASHNPYYLISLQAFDGVAAAIYGVLLTLVVADLAKGTGRFNLLQGSIQSAMGLGAFLSNLFFGFVAKGAGFNVSFWGLSLAAVAGGVLYQFSVPETHPVDESPSDERVPMTVE